MSNLILMIENFNLVSGLSRTANYLNFDTRRRDQGCGYTLLRPSSVTNFQSLKRRVTTSELGNGNGMDAPLRPRNGPYWRVLDTPATGGVHMEEITTVGLDLAKSVFQVHGSDRDGRPVLRKKLRRGQMIGITVVNCDDSALISIAKFRHTH